MEENREEQERERKLSKIHDVYEAINMDLLSGTYPDKKTRESVRERLLSSLDFLDDVICDETNNTAQVVDDEVILARCIWDRDPSKGAGYSYIDLAFGNPERTYKYLLTFK